MSSPGAIPLEDSEKNENTEASCQTGGQSSAHAINRKTRCVSQGRIQNHLEYPHLLGIGLSFVNMPYQNFKEVAKPPATTCHKDATDGNRKHAQGCREFLSTDKYNCSRFFFFCNNE